MSELEKEFSRRDLLRSSALVAAPLLAGSALPLQSQTPYYLNNPLPSIPSICGIAHALYVSAFRRDISTGYPYQTLDPNLVKNLNAQMNRFVQDTSSRGLLNQAWNPASVPNASQIDPNYISYVANHAQVGYLKQDFFNLISYDGAATDAGIQWDSNPSSGADLLAATQNAMNIMQPYTTGNFAQRRSTRRGAILMPAMYHYDDPDAHEKTLISYGGYMMAGGFGMWTAGGGMTTLTTAAAAYGGMGTAAGAFAMGLCWTGIGFFVIGGCVMLYVGYRLFLMKRGDVKTPYQKDNPNLLINQVPAWPNLYPPPGLFDPEPNPWIWK